MVSCECGRKAIGYLHDKDTNTYMPVCEEHLKVANKRISHYGVKNVKFIRTTEDMQSFKGSKYGFRW
ncbi:MAG: hypothetical protein M0R17_06980 [Candidatus Omnitrophica bacterium]|jgi:hypothetical protein|nr:hypothetical protein [Candidatus Omnitrophota bacterium]